MYSFNFRKIVRGTAIALVLFRPATAWAEGNVLFDLEDFQATWNASAGIGSFGVSQANFGGGSYDTELTPSSRRTDPIWAEGFVKPGIGVTQAAFGGQFYANFSTVFAQTLGDGDASLTTAMRGNPAQIGLEEANFGFTGDFSAIEPGTFDLQLGRQNLVIDDGFLIADGTINAGRRAAYYLAPRSVFDGIGVLHFNATPVRGDIFVLKDDTQANLSRRGFDQPPTTFAGFDISWFDNAEGDSADGGKTYSDRKRYVTATYFHITSSVLDGIKTSRDGMDVYSLSVGGAVLPSLPDFTFYAQGVLEKNSNIGRKVDANAYYIEPGWTFSELPLTPNIYYRYSHFSGARDPDATTNENYDGLFFSSGFRGTFGSYYYGEILSEYFVSNSNIDIHQVMMTLTMPDHFLNDQDVLKLDFIFYHYLYDQPAGLGLSSNSLGDEIDIAAEYQYSPQTSFALSVGLATPGAGAKESLTQQLSLPSNYTGRFNQTSGVAEIYASFSF
jgi:hypothetical protein